MARKEDRKKRKKTNRDAAERKYRAARAIRDQYPRIVVNDTGAPSAILSRVREILSELSPADESICPASMQYVLRQYKKLGAEEFIEAARDNISRQAAAGRVFPLGMEFAVSELVNAPVGWLSQWIYDRLPAEWRATPLPFHYFNVTRVRREFVIGFDFLDTIPSDSGTIYISPLRPTVMFQGGRWEYGYFRHAIERLCERISEGRTESYMPMEWGRFYLRNWMHSEAIYWPDSPGALRLYYDFMDVGLATRDFYREEVLGVDHIVPSEGPVAVVLGYCPFEVAKGKLVAKSFLLPGFRNTPESRLLDAAPISGHLRSRFREVLENTTFHGMVDNDYWEVIKWFHENGVSQAKQLTGETWASMG